MYVLSWNKVSEFQSLFFVCYIGQGEPKKMLFFRMKIYFHFRGAQSSLRIVNGY